MHELASRALFEDQTKHLADQILEVRHWSIVTSTYPVLEVRFEEDGRAPMHVRMECGDWHDVPPSVTLLDGVGKVLQVGAAPTGSNIFHQGPHSASRNLPFVCMAGTREYHTHSSHVGDSWTNYRTLSGYDLGGIMTQIWNGWRKCKP